jgi:PAS domain S-box-containing protein
MRFETLQDTSGVAIWDMEVDPDNLVGDDAPFWFSNQYRKILGYTGEHDFPNVLGSWNNSLHPEDYQRAVDAYDKHLADKTGRTPYDSEYRLKKKDGGYIQVRERGKTLRLQDGTPYRAFGIVEDISDNLKRGDIEDLINDYHEEINKAEKNLSELFSKTQTLRDAQELCKEQSLTSEKNALETSSILSEIKSVARYTNILSLNASIEAAHAGEYGKGFSIVAEEVRSLAAKSANATEKIEESVESILNSSREVARSAEKAIELADNQIELKLEVTERMDKAEKIWGELSRILKKSFNM